MKKPHLELFGTVTLLFLALTLGFRGVLSLSREEIRTEKPAACSQLPAEQIININTADADLLAELPGIGEVLADRIIAYRQEQGPFQSPEDIRLVPGIGRQVTKRVLPLITAGDPPSAGGTVPASGGRTGE